MSGLVKATIDLCTVEAVLRSPFYEHRRVSSSVADLHVDDREHLYQAIAAFSYQAEQHCGRWFRLAAYTEVLDTDEGQHVVQLRAYPVASVASVKEDYEGDFASVTALDATDYALVRGGRSGQLRLRGTRPFIEATQGLQVVYTGGLAAVVHQLPADLRMAAVEQVPYMLERAKTAHLTGQSGPEGSATYFRATPLLPSVAALLGPYRTP